MKKIFLLILCLFVLSEAKILGGWVRDTSTFGSGNPVQGIEVSFLGEKDTTDATGYFKILAPDGIDSYLKAKSIGPVIRRFCPDSFHVNPDAISHDSAYNFKEFFYVRGFVKDTLGHPLKNFKVISKPAAIDLHTDTTLTDSTGYYKLYLTSNWNNPKGRMWSGSVLVQRSILPVAIHGYNPDSVTYTNLSSCKIQNFTERPRLITVPARAYLMPIELDSFQFDFDGANFTLSVPVDYKGKLYPILNGGYTSSPDTARIVPGKDTTVIFTAVPPSSILPIKITNTPEPKNIIRFYDISGRLLERNGIRATGLCIKQINNKFIKKIIVK